MQFYRVLIVDDEPYIVHCLADLLASQQDLNLDLCHAYSCEEALRHLERQRIDILLSDIEMPGISGIELVRTVKKRWPACKTLLITAHPDFQYAYEAFRLDIVSYILKTETDDRIVTEVKKSIRMLEEELNQTGLITENSEDMRNAINLVRRELFFSILNNRNDTLDEGARILRALGFHQSLGCLFILSARILGTRNADDPGNADALAKAFYTVKMIMSYYITSTLPVCCCETRQDRVYWLLQPGKKSDPFAPWLIGMLETVQQSCMTTAGIHISFIVSPAVTTLAELAAAYQKNEMMLHRVGIRQTDFIYSAETETAQAPEDAVGFDRESSCSQLRFLFETERYPEFLRLMDTICEPLLNWTDWHDLAASERYYAIALLLLSLIDRRGLRRQIEERVNLSSLLYPYTSDSWYIAAQNLKSLASSLLESCKDDQENISWQTIKRTKEYIDQHINQDITLQQLSVITGYNLSYLSRFFTEKTGENLNQYISRRRLIYIRGLMSDSKMSLGDIAEKAGFKTRSYFNRFIKRVSGTTPQKLREEELR